MIITRTPFRISFFGGGTDYPAWFKYNGGNVITTTIDKYCYITCRKLPPFFSHKHRIAYSKIELVNSVDEIQHPSVKATFKYYKIADGLEVHHDGDLPARSGLGSSSSFTVSLVNTLSALRGQRLTKQNLANIAIDIEQNIIKENVGSQDQVATAYGGFNRINFYKDNTFHVEPIFFSTNRKKIFHSHLLLCFTGFSRIASEIAASQISNFSKKENELRKISSMVDIAQNILQDESKNLDDFGYLLDDYWNYKKSLSDNVSNEFIDNIYKKAMNAGAFGGKILGAGGGGFLLLYAKPEFHDGIKKALGNLIYVPFEFENSGSTIALYEPQGF